MLFDERRILFFPFRSPHREAYSSHANRRGAGEAPVGRRLHPRHVGNYGPGEEEREGGATRLHRRQLLSCPS